MSIRITQYPILPRVVVVLAALASLIWLQSSVNLAQAEEPTNDPNLSVQIVRISDPVDVAAIGSAPTFNVGDVFQISVVAQNVNDPGIFGSQFELAFDPTFLNVVEGSLQSGESLVPVVTALSNVDNTNGAVAYAASRQGDLDNVSGDVVLARLQFEAIASTEPPEGQTTTIELQNVKLGAKGGIEIPVKSTVNLDVIIKDGNGGGGDDDVIGTGDIDVDGTVLVEARAADNQAGTDVTIATDDASRSSTVSTDAAGAFNIPDVAAALYDLTANRAGFLAASCADVDISANTTLLQTTLLAGDVVEDNTIDITDAVAIGSALDSADAVADLTADGTVDILDLILMAANFGETSEANPWVCVDAPLADSE